MALSESIGDWYARVFETLEQSDAPREVTLQLTEACNLACTYCYQIAKTPKVMSWNVAKRIIDFLFELSETDNDSCININTPWLVLDFIGGEPLLQTELMSKICHYFVTTAVLKKHRWATHFSISISSNGTLYFDEKFQQFLKDFEGHISFSVSIDGDQETHDKCRIYPDGCGSFCDAKCAQDDYRKTHSEELWGTKATIARANLPYIDSIIKYFASEGYKQINANTIYEEDWNVDDAKLYYNKLIEIADFSLELPEEIQITLFSPNFFVPRNPEDGQTWCGGYNSMLAFDTEGNAYPCIRYMPSSLGCDVPAIVIGNCWDGLYTKENEIETKRIMDATTWLTQNTEECLTCPIATGCADCAAWSYQAKGKLGVRDMSSCIMHKARSLANVYYWNKLYLKYGEKRVFEMHLPEEEALKIIDQETLNMLLKLVEDARCQQSL